MAAVTLGKSIDVPARPDVVLGALQDPIFWTQLPCTFRRLDFRARPFALGTVFKPGFDEFRFAALTPDSVSFRSRDFGFTVGASPGNSVNECRLDIEFQVDCPT